MNICAEFHLNETDDWPTDKVILKAILLALDALFSCGILYLTSLDRCHTYITVSKQPILVQPIMYLDELNKVAANLEWVLN